MYLSLGACDHPIDYEINSYQKFLREKKLSKNL